MSNSDIYRYSAFISYVHQPNDKRWALWIQRQIETYKLPKRLKNSLSQPKHLKPCFRDEDELNAGIHLSSGLQDALKTSQYLIIIASPNSACSRWMQMEASYFASLGRSDRILTLLIEGSPADHIWITSMTNAHTAATEQTSNATLDLALAADIRLIQGHSRRHIRHLAKLRILARLIGCQFDELRQREHERQLRTLTNIAVCSLCSLLFISALAIYAWQQKGAARRNADDARNKLHVATDTLQFVLDRVSTPLRETLGTSFLRETISEGVRDRLKGISAVHTDDPEVILDLATLTYLDGAAAFISQDLVRAHDRFISAESQLRTLLSTYPNNIQAESRLTSVIGMLAGFIESPEFGGSTDRYSQEYEERATRLVRQHPENKELAIICINAVVRRIEIAQKRGAFVNAQAECKRALELAEDALKRFGSADGTISERKADILSRYAQVDFVTNHITSGLEHGEIARELLEGLSSALSSSYDIQFKLCTVYQTLGAAYINSQDSRAYDLLTRAIDRLNHLIQVEQQRGDARRLMVTTCWFMQDLLERSGKTAEGLQYLERARVQSEFLLSAEPDSPLIAVMHAKCNLKLGRSLRVSRTSDDARMALAKAADIYQKLTMHAPGTLQMKVRQEYLETLLELLETDKQSPNAYFWMNIQIAQSIADSLEPFRSQSSDISSLVARVYAWRAQAALNANQIQESVSCALLAQEGFMSTVQQLPQDRAAASAAFGNLIYLLSLGQYARRVDVVDIVIPQLKAVLIAAGANGVTDLESARVARNAYALMGQYLLQQTNLADASQHLSIALNWANRCLIESTAVADDGHQRNFIMTLIQRKAQIDSTESFDAVLRQRIALAVQTLQVFPNSIELRADVIAARIEFADFLVASSNRNLETAKECLEAALSEMAELDLPNQPLLQKYNIWTRWRLGDIWEAKQAYLEADREHDFMYNDANDLRLRLSGDLGALDLWIRVCQHRCEIWAKRGEVDRVNVLQANVAKLLSDLASATPYSDFICARAAEALLKVDKPVQALDWVKKAAAGPISQDPWFQALYAYALYQNGQVSTARQMMQRLVQQAQALKDPRLQQFQAQLAQYAATRSSP